MNNQVATNIKIGEDNIYFMPLTVKPKLGLPIKKVKSAYYGGKPVTFSALDVEGEKGSLSFDAIADEKNIGILNTFAKSAQALTVIVTYDNGKKWTFTGARLTEDPEIGGGIDGVIPFKIESDVVVIS